ncbi:Hypothetical protein NocV09_01001720 [Nannochloropsis oceanica]
MNKWSDDDWYQEVRFSKEQFEYLCQELHVPLVFPTEKQRQESSTFRKVRMLDGRLVFAITLSRLAQPTTVKGQMTRKWGYHRMEITKWTNACMECLMDTIAVYLPEYATAVGKKIGMNDPSLCTIFGFLDGCLV